MIRIIPSLASAPQLNLKNEIDRLGELTQIHLDIEDGNFLPNITFGMKTIRAVASYTDRALDAHLMVTNPNLYIEELVKLGVGEIAIHVEAVPYPSECLSKIRSCGAKAGLAFNCRAPIELALPYQEDIDYIIIMTSEPDGREQLFKPQMLQKIEKARSLLPGRIGIMADGGITDELFPRVVAAGADTVIMGRALWNAENPAQHHHELLRAVGQAQ